MNAIKNISTFVQLACLTLIITTLSSTAVPKYDNYVIRSKVNEVIAYANAVKIAVAEYYVVNGYWPSTAAEAELSPAESHYVGNLIFSPADGRFLIGVQDVVSSINGNYITFSPTATQSGITWSCYSITVSDSLLPEDCRL